MNYKEAKSIHTSNIFEQFNTDPLFLFLNQFMKAGNKELQAQFLKYINFTPTGRLIAEKFLETYNYVQSNNLLDSVIQFIIDNRDEAIWFSEKETQQKLQELSNIDLSKDNFNPTSNIDKTLFNRVQRATSISELTQIINNIENMLEKKIYWTYYNTQTTRLIEDIFNKHLKVTPTLVDIKGVDFFINKIPLDLKITRIPQGFDTNFDKETLIKWLYEQQSKERFGAENRLFLILNDSSNPTNSDRLKTSHYNLIKTTINAYLNTYTDDNLLNIGFTIGDNIYRVKSDLIFINV